MTKVYALVLLCKSLCHPSLTFMLKQSGMKGPIDIMSGDVRITGDELYSFSDKYCTPGQKMSPPLKWLNIFPLNSF